MKKINLAISGCMGRMGQQLIKVEGNMGVLMGLKPVMEKMQS